MAPRTFLAAAAFVVAFAAGAAEARADGASDLEKAHDAYVAKDYADAEARLRILLDPKTGTLKDPDNVAEARMYLGASLWAEGKKDDAAKTFDQLLLDKPDYEPDQFRVDKEHIQAFRDEQARLREQLAALQAEKVKKQQEEKAKVAAAAAREALRLKMLEQLAGEETVIETSSRWKAMLPFGVGQFQNGQSTLGWTLLVGESVFALGSVVGGVGMLYNVVQQDDNAGQSQLAQGYHDRAVAWFVAGDVFFGLFAVTAAGGVLHAQLTFVPEHVTIRKRDIPPPPQVTLAPILGPAGVGLRGSF